MNYFVGNILVVSAMLAFCFLIYRAIILYAKNLFSRFVCIYLLASLLSWLCIFSAETGLTNICWIKRLGVNMRYKNPMLIEYYELESKAKKKCE